MIRYFEWFGGGDWETFKAKPKFLYDVKKKESGAPKPQHLSVLTCQAALLYGSVLEIKSESFGWEGPESETSWWSGWKSFTAAYRNVGYKMELHETSQSTIWDLALLVHTMLARIHHETYCVSLILREFHLNKVRRRNLAIKNSWSASSLDISRETAVVAYILKLADGSDT